MTTFDVKVDTSEALSFFQRLSAQMSFATSKALNAVANTGQQAIRGEVSKRFTLRRPSFVLNTIKIERADRATKTKLDVTIRVDPTRDMLAKHEAGGPKLPRSGSNIAVPTINVRRGKTDVVRAGQRPRALLDSGKASRGRVFKTAKGIFERVGTKASAVVRALYIFRPSVRIQPNLRFVATATEAVNKTWVKEMTKAFDDAQKTAR